MMMSERCQDPESGLLLYLRTSSLQEVQAGINEMRGLIQLRNQLIVHLKDQVHWTSQKGIIKSPIHWIRQTYPYVHVQQQFFYFENCASFSSFC